MEVKILLFPQMIHLFLIINYKEDNLELEKTIESKMAIFGATSILKARQQYIKKYPTSLLEELQYSLNSNSLNEDSKVMDIPDQIHKLFELVEK